MFEKNQNRAQFLNYFTNSKKISAVKNYELVKILFTKKQAT